MSEGSSWKATFLGHTLKDVAPMSQTSTFKTLEKLMDSKLATDLGGLFMMN